MLSPRVTRLSPSATLAMSARSAELRAQGIDVINLSVGEPDFPTPAHIKQAAFEAIEKNITTYSPVPGYPALRQAICKKLQDENGLAYEPAQIVVGNGAKQCVATALMALLAEGDEVVIPAPYWVSYPQMVLMVDGVPVTVEAPLEQGFKITPEQLESVLTPRTRALILCSPSNPTGAVYTAEELEGLACVLRRHPDVVVISDEIYEHITYCGAVPSIARCEGMKERTVVINGVSKAYAMTGWRIGFLAAPKELAAACSKLQGQYTSGPCSVSQMAALAAYTAPQTCVEEMRQQFERRRDLLYQLCAEIEGLEVGQQPTGAFYLFPSCAALFGKKYTDAEGAEHVIRTSTDFCLYLLDEAHVATVAGDAFGSPACFRMSYATSDENIREAISRIARAIALLK